MGLQRILPPLLRLSLGLSPLPQILFCLKDFQLWPSNSNLVLSPHRRFQTKECMLNSLYLDFSMSSNINSSTNTSICRTLWLRDYSNCNVRLNVYIKR